MHFIYIKNGVQYCIDEQFTCESCISNHHQNFKYQLLLFALIFTGLICLIFIKSPIWFIDIVVVTSLPYFYFFMKNYNRKFSSKLHNEDMITHCIECGQTN